jgi:pseudaminic acid synthase
MIIDKLKINYDTPPKIIAEISGNHNGNKELFLNHIISAHNNGADFVKIQTYEPKDITLKNSFLIKNGLWKNQSLWSLYKKACTPFSWHDDAFKLAKKYKIKLFSSPFSLRAVDLLEKYNVKLYKIASFEITDLKLIDYIAKKNKPIILSTGLSNLNEIKNAVRQIKKYHSKIILLHCISNYPTKLENSKLSRIDFLKKNFKKISIGISDHTNNNISSFIATSKKVCLIEKHFKISNSIKSPDSEFSITPEQLKDLKENTVKIHQSLFNENNSGNNSDEEKNSLIFRRSIYSVKSIKKDQVIKIDNITTLRPHIGISADQYFNILGKRVKKKIKKNSPIYLKDLS